MIYVYLLIVFVSIQLLVLYNRGFSFFSPIVVFLCSLFLSLLHLSSQLLVYENYLHLNSFSIIFLCMTSMTLGAFLFRQRDVGIHTNIRLHSYPTSNIRLVFVSATIYVLLQLVESFSVLRSTGFNIDLVTLRTMRLEEKGRSTSLLSLLLGISRSFAYILVTFAYPIFRIWKSKIYKVVFIGVIIAIFAETLIDATRSSFVYCIILLFFSWMTYYKLSDNRSSILKNWKLAIPSFVIGISLFYLIFGYFPAKRNPDLVDKLTYYIQLGHERELAPWIMEIKDESDVGRSIAILAASSNYLHLGIIKLDYFLEYDIDQWYEMGGYNLNVIEKLMTGSTANYQRISGELANISIKDGYNENPWGSGFRDMLIDFGWSGSIFLLFLFSVSSQKLYRKVFLAPNYANVSLLSIILLSMLVFPHTSPFRVMFIGQTLLLAFLLKTFKV